MGATLVATAGFGFAYWSYYESRIDYTDQKIYSTLYGATVGAFSAGFAAWKGRKAL